MRKEFVLTLMQWRSNFTRLCSSWLAKPHPAPIFILGNQKSGTTIIASLLAELTGLSITLDLRNPIKNPVMDRIRNGEMSFAKFIRMNRLDLSRQIVKDPNLSLCFNELTAHFPGARFIMVMRDPRDNIRSMLDRLKFPGDLTDLDADRWARVKRGWRLILDGRWLGLSGRNYIEMMAARWNLIAQTYLAHRDRMILIRYEDFMKDKAVAIARLAERLDLRAVHDIAGKVDVQYQSRGNREVKWIHFFGMENLGRVNALCRENMQALGYPEAQP
ncbi:MAG: hypothetical protein QOF48_2959 [Verrucomicrobiota bacterium]|jgi:hypothetical protein